MKLTCKKCQTPIPDDKVNLREGVGYCENCQEYFRIADYLRDDEEIRRIAKPYYSKISIDKTSLNHLITIPPAGWSGSAIFFLVFALFWNGVSWPLFFISGDLSGFVSLFMIPFILIGLLVIFIFLYQVTGRTYINFNKEYIEAVWQLFQFKIKRTRKTRNLMKITEDVMYTKNYQPVYGIGIFFTSGKKLRFGSGLKEEERKWLIGELYELWEHYKKAV